MDALSPPGTPAIRLQDAGTARPACVATPAEADRRRFEALYERHAAAVLAYARRRTDPQSAQDVLAEAFLVAWRRRRDIPDDALPWLYAVAGNALHNQRRAARRQTAVGARLAAEPAPVPASTASQASGEDVGLLRALATLRPMDREALLLTAWEGLDPARAARAAGCTRATFNVRLHRARRRLARALEDQADEASATPTSAPEGTTPA